MQLLCGKLLLKLRNYILHPHAHIPFDRCTLFQPNPSRPPSKAMFSSWRHTVESLSQPPKNPQDASSPNGDEAPVRSSVDGVRSSPSSSSHLAESALSSLKKSLAAQRPASPGTNHTRTTSASSSIAEPAPISSPAPSPKPRTAGRSTLEDRLRAKFAIGDASNSSTPTASARVSPSPILGAEHPLAISPRVSQDQDIPVVKGPPNPLSPTSTPLPDSPLQSPVDGANSLDALTECKTAPTPSSLPAPTPEVAVPSNRNDETVAPKEETSPPTDVNSPISSMQPVSSSSAEEQTSQLQPPTAEAQVTEAPSAQETNSLPEETRAADTSPLDNEDLIQFSSDSAPPPPSEDPTVPNDTSSDASVSQIDAPANSPTERPSAHPMPVDNPDGENIVNGDNGDASSQPAAVVIGDKHPEPVTPVEAASATVQSRALNGKSSDGVDVEALQKRLKLVEQRFAGRCFM